MILSKLGYALVAVSLMSLGACAGVVQIDDHESAGFLTDEVYSKLAPTNDSVRVMRQDYGQFRVRCDHRLGRRTSRQTGCGTDQENGKALLHSCISPSKLAVTPNPELAVILTHHPYPAAPNHRCFTTCPSRSAADSASTVLRENSWPRGPRRWHSSGGTEFT